MRQSVWIFQRPRDVKAKGPDQATWQVGWYDLSGKRHSEACGSGDRGRRAAERRRDRIAAELELEVHEPKTKHKWTACRKAYNELILDHKALSTKKQIISVLNHFERLVKPGLIGNITTNQITKFVSDRSKEAGKKKGAKLSPATVNKDLRHLKAFLRFAVDEGYLSKMPKIKMQHEPGKLVRFVTPEDFAVMYNQAAKLAEKPTPDDNLYTSEHWWQALIATAYMTGWRISELMALKWEDVDLTKQEMITRYQDNKGKRTEKVAVHPIVIEHIGKLKGTSPFVFQWDYCTTHLWIEFHRIQKAAGIKLVCREKHEHTDACNVYGFHDLRRAFATVNAPRMKPEVLQKLMRHQSYKTTLGYINQSQQIAEAVERMQVPDVLNKNTDSSASPPL